MSSVTVTIIATFLQATTIYVLKLYASIPRELAQ